MYSNIGLNLTRSNIVLRYAFLILISIIFFFINPNVLILCLCVLFEYFINRIKINFKFSFNSEFVGLILLSYYTEPIYAIIFLFLTIVLRLVMGRFVLNYIWKQPIFILFAYIIPNLRMLSLIQVGIIFNVIR